MWVYLRRFVAGVALALTIFPASPARALDADDLEALLGYTMVAHSNVRGESEGADPDKPVVLDNGWVFEFSDYNYDYAYRPAVAVFAKRLQFRDPKSGAQRSITIYKLVIGEELYDARRLR